jgi:ATP/maltotriose-dependent transcriptional regulator MalT
VQRCVGPWLRAEILLDLDGDVTDEAEALFRQPLEIARRQEAKTFELCAATSLARLWQRQGRRDAARALLARSRAGGWTSSHAAGYPMRPA